MKITRNINGSAGMHPVKSNTDPYDIFMLMDYSCGYEGMESDCFQCLGKFYAPSLESAQAELKNLIASNPNAADLDGLYVSEYNEYFDDFDEDDLTNDHANNVYVDLRTLFNNVVSSEPWDDSQDLPYSCTVVGAADSKISATLKDEVYETAKKVMMSPKFGFDEADVEAYLFVDVYPKDNATVVELRAELSYDGMIELANACDPVVEKYDDDAYFDMDSPGIAVAYIRDKTQNVQSSTYGGAYDLDDDMFFTKEEVDEWAYDIVDEFNNRNDENYRLEDIYFNDAKNATIEIGNSDYTLIANVNIDMRKIRSPRDINKYSEQVLEKLQQQYNDNSINIEMSTNIKAAHEYDVPDHDLDDNFKEYDKVEDVKDTIHVNLDNVIIIVDDDGFLDYEDQETPWAFDIDAYSEEYPEIELDDGGGISENVINLIESYLPAEPGRYAISCQIDLVYQITGVESELKGLYKDEDGKVDEDVEIYTDNASVEFLYRDSTVDDFEYDAL